MARSILVINGPNLNLLGLREPHIYGKITLADVQSDLQGFCAENDSTVSFFQSNSESHLIDRIHACKYPQYLQESSSLDLGSLEGVPTVDAIIINAGAYTHTSVAIRDALGAVGIPFVEVHVTNVHAREEFRHKSFLSDKATAVICGLGVYGYKAAAEFCVRHLKV